MTSRSCGETRKFGWESLSDLKSFTVVEIAHKWHTEGRLPIKSGSIKGRVTYHDPCNVGRKLGIFAGAT